MVLMTRQFHQKRQQFGVAIEEQAGGLAVCILMGGAATTGGRHNGPILIPHHSGLEKILELLTTAHAERPR